MLFNIFMLAHELSKDVEEVEHWGVDKVAYWLAYFKVVHENRAKEAANRNKGKGRRPGG